jgi:hypothetical protein
VLVTAVVSGVDYYRRFNALSSAKVAPFPAPVRDRKIG